MVTICQQCGDKGYSNALIYCDGCDNYAVHRYCLKVLPETFDEYVIWLCEDCEPKSAKALALDNSCPLLIKESESLENVQVNKSRPIRRLGKKSKGNVRVNQSRPIRRLGKKSRGHVRLNKSSPITRLGKKSMGRKVSSHSLNDLKLLRPDHCSCQQPLELHCSESSEKGQKRRKDHGLYEGISSEVTEFKSKNTLPALCDPQNMEDCSENCEKDQKLRIPDKFDEGRFHEEAESLKSEDSQIPASGLQDLEANLCLQWHKDQKPGRPEGLDCCSFYEEAESHETKNSQLALSGLEMDCCTGDPSFPGEASPKTKKSQPVNCDRQLVEMDCCNGGVNNQSHGGPNVSHKDRFNEEAESNKAKNLQLAIFDSSNALDCCSYVHAQPIKDPIWSGCLNTQFGSVGGLVAHLSNIACSRAREKAKSLPNLLLSELLPISAVWPKGFEKWGPSDDSIALYFFPDNGRDEKVFDCLVNDMICQNLSMKAVLEDTELLIFTSTILPMDYWGFQAKFYLWGVFKGKQEPCLAIDAVPVEEKEHIKTITWDTCSPVSTLSNDCNVPSSTHSPHP